MTEKEKINFYESNREFIHQTIKNEELTKPLWRRLFWTTGKNSDKYKIGCVDIFESHFPSFFEELNS